MPWLYSKVAMFIEQDENVTNNTLYLVEDGLQKQGKHHQKFL